MPSHRAKVHRNLPLTVPLVALYQLAKGGFFIYVFLQCWQLQGSDMPPFGGDVHNPLFKSPYMFLFPLLAVFQLMTCLGLFFRADWARVFCLFLPVGTIPLWFLEWLVGYRSLLFPVAPSTMVTFFALELIAIALLYGTPQAKEAFAPVR